MSHVPVRTCVGCRRRAPKADLLRVVWLDGAVRVDGRHRAPGRGAYLHRDADCLDQALRRRSLSRALGVTGIDSTGLAADVAAHLGTAPGPAQWPTSRNRPPVA